MKPPFLGIATDRWLGFAREFGRTLAALLLAVMVVFVIVMLTSEAPGKALNVLFNTIFSKTRTVGLWLDDAAKLTITGLAFSLVFQARQFALGVQGQIYMGALAATYLAFSPLGSSWAAIPLGILAAMIAGALYGLLPAIAKVRLGANEIVSTLMLNYIAIEICNYMIRAQLPKPRPGVLNTSDFPDASVFPALVERTRLDLGIIIAITMVALIWFLLYRTAWGLRLRLVGNNARFAQCAGISAAYITISAMTVAGALGGLLGSMFVQGQAFGRLATSFESNLSYEGILVAIVARNHPLAVPFAALFYSYLRQGAQLMNIRTDVPAEIIGVVTAIIILLVSSNFSWPQGRFMKHLINRHKPS